MCPKIDNSGMARISGQVLSPNTTNIYFAHGILAHTKDAEQLPRDKKICWAAPKRFRTESRR